MSFVPAADQHLASECHKFYMMGWRDGAGVRLKFPLQEARSDLKAEYENGYADGRQAERRSSNLCAKRTGYVPSRVKKK